MRRSTGLLLLTLVPAVALGGFRASSFKKETRLGVNTWNVASAIDGDPETCWMVNPEEENEGSWIEIDLPKAEIDKLGVRIGWDMSDDKFLDYARIKTLKVDVIDDGMANEGTKVLEHSISFEDKRGWQLIDLPDTAFGDEFGGGRVRLTVKEVYPGKDYPNLAVSEVLVHLKDMDAPTMLVTPPENAASGHEADNLFDGNDRSYWASDGPAAGATFEVGADGFGLSKVGLKAGPKDYGRPKTLEITANDRTQTVVLEDKTETQWFDIPAVVGFTGSGWSGVTVKVIDTYEGTNPGVAFSEVQLKATSYEGL